MLVVRIIPADPGDLLAKTWEDVLSRAAAATKTDFVKTAAEYGTTLELKDKKAEIIQKFELSYSDFLSELLRAQEVDENYFSQMDDNPTRGRSETQPQPPLPYQSTQAQLLPYQSTQAQPPQDQSTWTQSQPPQYQSTQTQPPQYQSTQTQPS